MKTFTAKKEELKREWYVIDLKDQILGKAAVEISTILQGKHKPTFTPHVDTGDFIVVINADKIKLTGKKWDDKTYYFHSGYVGHLKSFSASEMMERRPEFIVKKAVRGMLPKSKLGRSMLTKLKVYAGEVHPHEAQKPKVYELKTNK